MSDLPTKTERGGGTSSRPRQHFDRGAVDVVIV